MNKKYGIGILALAVLIVVTAVIFRAPGFKNALASSNTIATYNGGELKVQDVMAVVEIEPDMPVETIFNLKLAATVQMVKRRLLEQEAARQNLTPDEVVAKAASGSGPAATKYLDDLFKKSDVHIFIDR